MSNTRADYPKFEFHSVNDHVPCLSNDYIIKGMCLKGEVSVINAPSNVGKTALAVSFAAHIVNGSKILGMRTLKGIVVHVCAEGVKSVKDRGSVALKAGENSCEYIVTGTRVDLTDVYSVQMLIDGVREQAERFGQPVSLITIDTFICSIGDRNENSSVDMANAIAGAQMIATAFDAHTMLIHHTGKDEERGNRGSSVIRTNVDSEMSIKKDEETKEATLFTTKQRNLDTDLSFRFRLKTIDLGLDDDGELRTTVIAEFIEGSKGKAPLQKKPIEGKALAVFTAVRAASKLNKSELTTSEVLDIVPIVELSTASSDAARMRAVRALLEGLVKRGKILKLDKGKGSAWRLKN